MSLAHSLRVCSLWLADSIRPVVSQEQCVWERKAVTS